MQTPRWLIANDRTDEALVIMAKYHGEGDRQSPIVQLEYEEMRRELSCLVLTILFGAAVDAFDR